ncbi:MAG: hypothetical protein WBW48_04160 [Anaerolineae bacterium]
MANSGCTGWARLRVIRHLHWACGTERLVQAMELARHADPRTTKRYFHNLDKLRNHAVNLSPIGLSAIA